MSERTDGWLRRIARHIYQHPYRLTVTVAVVLFISWAAAIGALVHSLQVGHNSRVENCRSIDELNRELRLAWIDAGYPAIGMRFEDTRNCDVLP